MDYIHMLDGMSPWWWVILAFALGSLEMATMSFFLIWPGLAALCMAGILVAAPNMSGTAQIALFAIFSIILTFAGRYLLNRYGDGAESTDQTLNNRSAHLIGQAANVLEFNDGNGVVEVEGMRWRAQWAADQVSNPGQSVKITHADAMVLYVENYAKS
jgi:membrane protein implicated in regulation of membrane protease activity